MGGGRLHSPGSGLSAPRPRGLVLGLQEVHRAYGGHAVPTSPLGGIAAFLTPRTGVAGGLGGRCAALTRRAPQRGGGGGGDARHWPHSAGGTGRTEASPHRVSRSGPLRPANPARLLSRVFALAASGPKGHGAGLMGSVLDCREGRTRSDPFSRGGGAPRGTRPSVCTCWDTTPQSCHPKTHDVPRVRVASPHVTRVPLGRRPTPPRRRVSPPEP